MPPPSPLPSLSTSSPPLTSAPPQQNPRDPPPRPPLLPHQLANPNPNPRPRPPALRKLHDVPRAHRQSARGHTSRYPGPPKLGVLSPPHLLGKRRQRRDGQGQKRGREGRLAQRPRRTRTEPRAAQERRRRRGAHNARIPRRRVRSRGVKVSISTYSIRSRALASHDLIREARCGVTGDVARCGSVCVLVPHQFRTSRYNLCIHTPDLKQCGYGQTTINILSISKIGVASPLVILSSHLKKCWMGKGIVYTSSVPSQGSGLIGI